MSTQSKRFRQLDEIYRMLPGVECQGLCWQNCAAVPVYDVEIKRLEQVAKRSLPMLDIQTPGTAKIMGEVKNQYVCPLLVMRRCSVYDHRPFICRIFAIAQGMPCQHGCKPTRILTDQEVITIQRKIEKL